MPALIFPVQDDAVFSLVNRDRDFVSSEMWPEANLVTVLGFFLEF